MTTTTINAETTSTAKTASPHIEIVTTPMTVIQTPVVIEPALVQDVTSTSPSQPAVTTITTVTLPISLPIQAVMGPIQAVKSNIVPLIPTEDPTIQILSLDTHITGTTEVLDPNNINITVNVPEITLDTLKNTSFEKDHSDEELCFPGMKNWKNQTETHSLQHSYKQLNRFR